MATEELGAVELSEQERVELKQLAELILETAVSDELFEDLVALSAPILEHGRDGNPEDDGTWSAGTGWASFPTYQTALTILFELILGDSVDYLADGADQRLTAAAKTYGQHAEKASGEDAPPATEAELEEIAEILNDRYGPGFFGTSLIAQLLDGETPEFLLEARDFGWLDPAAVEATVEHFEKVAGNLLDPEARRQLDAATDSLVQTIRESIASYDLTPVTQISDEVRAMLGTRIYVESDAYDPLGNHAGADLFASPSNSSEPSWTPPVEFDLEADLSADKQETDSNDEDDWELLEIAPGDESEVDHLNPLDEDPTDRQDRDHSGHVHRVLDGEIRSLGDYEGEPAEDGEITLISLIAEGVLLTPISEILLADLLAEAEPLIRRARAAGPDWWMTADAAEAVADLLSRLLTGEPWKTPEGGSAEILLGGARVELDRLKRLAESYPLDPEPTRDERIQQGSLTDRYEALLAERGERNEPEFTDVELQEISEVIAEIFGEEPTPRLVDDAADLLPDVYLEAGRYYNGWYEGAGRALADIISELLTGVSTRGKAINTSDELLGALRTYRTEDLTEDEFIAHYDQSRWPSIGATVDLSIFTVIDGKLQVLLIERGNHPEKGKWALPGGFVNVTESLDQAAARELQEETAVDLSAGGYLEQVKTYGYPGRDRRGFIISTLYAALIAELPEPEAGDDASGARFVPVDEALSAGFPLAFDHDTLLRDALERVRAKLEYSPIVFDFLPEGGFTLTELREVYETVWGFRLLPSDFNRRISQAQGALGLSETLTDGKVLWTRGAASTFFPPLDRRQVARD